VTAGGQIDGDVLGGVLSTSGSVTKNFASGIGRLRTYRAPWTVSNSLTLSSPAALAAFTGTGAYHAVLTGWSSADSSGTGNATYDPGVHGRLR
jgi:hypothetical protein